MCVCVHLWLKFMGCCDSIPQIRFKVAVTAFVETNWNRVCVCVHLWVAVTASLRFVLKLHGQYFFKTNWNRVCVCVFMGCCDSTPQCKSVEVFFLFLGAGGSTTALLETCLTRICVLFGAACASLKFQSHSIMKTLWEVWRGGVRAAQKSKVAKKRVGE